MMARVAQTIEVAAKQALVDWANQPFGMADRSFADLVQDAAGGYSRLSADLRPVFGESGAAFREIKRLPDALAKEPKLARALGRQ